MNTRNRSGAAPSAALVLTLAALLTLVAGCGRSSTGATPASSSSPTSSTSSMASSGSSPTTAEDHLVDVGGHKLWLSCVGTGSPTVVYVHGWVNDAGHVPHDGAQGISDLLAKDHRVCLYDRRNVGSSETVDAVQSPAAMLQDMETVLARGGARPPYILMAASFGGLLAYDFLNHHPDQVRGLVFLDAMFPDELALDRYLPADATFRHFEHEDMCCTLERISEYLLIRSLQRYVGHEPRVPMVYLASKQEPRDQNDYQSPEYDARVVDLQKAFVHRFAPGRFEWVDAPHFMEPVIPDRIARAVRDVDALASD